MAARIRSGAATRFSRGCDAVQIDVERFVTGAIEADGSARVNGAGADRLIGIEAVALDDGTLLLGRGTDALALAGAFVGSVECAVRNGDPADAEAFRAVLSINALGPAPDDAGLAFWPERRARDVLPRAKMLLEFAESAENHPQTAEETEAGVFFEDVVVQGCGSN
ncbi:MAG: DUF4214 domain-containing protein [Pseudomonadota bacterium]